MSYPNIPYQPNFFLQSDTEIYNCLMDAKKSGHPLLKHFKILYPDKVPQEQISAIYVGRMDTTHKLKKDSFSHTHWDVMTEIFITTKSYDKLSRRKMLKTATYAVIEVIKNSVIGDFVNIVSQQFIYDKNNLLQYSRISLRTAETSHKESIEKEMLEVCKILTEISVEEDIITNTENGGDNECLNFNSNMEHDQP